MNPFLSKDFEVPENVGIPIGGDEGDCMYRLEIHFNNPTLTEGIIQNCHHFYVI